MTRRRGLIRTLSKRNALPTINIAIIGPSSGKTSLIKRYIKKKFSKTISETRITRIFQTSITLKRVVNLKIIDTPGDEKIFKQESEKIDNIDGIIFVFSLVDISSLSSLNVYRQLAISQCQDTQISQLLIGTKSDCKRIIKRKEGKAYSFIFGCPYVEVSSKENINVKESFETIIKMIMSRFQVFESGLGLNYTLDNISFEGYLRRKGQLSTTKYWCILQENFLYFFKETKSGRELKERIRLDNARPRPIFSKTNSFEIATPLTTFVLRAESQLDMVDWIRSIQEIVELKENKEDGSVSPFKLLLKNQDNQICADCLGSDPLWASIKFGTIVCSECARFHESNKIISLISGKWNSILLDIMIVFGNHISNSVLESGNLPPRPSNRTSHEVKSKFIKRKYKGEFVNKEIQDLSIFQKALFNLILGRVEEVEEEVEEVEGEISSENKIIKTLISYWNDEFEIEIDSSEEEEIVWHPDEPTRIENYKTILEKKEDLSKQRKLIKSSFLLPSKVKPEWKKPKIKLKKIELNIQKSHRNDRLLLSQILAQNIAEKGKRLLPSMSSYRASVDIKKSILTYYYPKTIIHRRRDSLTDRGKSAVFFTPKLISGGLQMT